MHFSINKKGEKMYRWKKVSELKKGDFFTLEESSELCSKNVLVRGEFDRTSKTYICSSVSDNSFISLSGDKLVFFRENFRGFLCI